MLHRMQKCVRRRLPRDAARLAHALLAASPSDALRRVAVMAAEDAAVHPHLPAVVWMMMAVAKGFALTADHTALVIRVVSDLAGTHVRDALPDNPPASAGVRPPPSPPMCLIVICQVRIPFCAARPLGSFPLCSLGESNVAT